MTPRSKVLDYLSVIKPTVDDLSRWKDPDTRSRLHIPHGIQTPENLLIGLGIHPRENPTPPEIIAHIKTLISPL